MLSLNIQFQLLFHHFNNGILCLSELLVTFVNVLVFLANCDGEVSEPPLSVLNALVVVGDLLFFPVTFVPEVMQSPS
jgi:hypothetical protein